MQLGLLSHGQLTFDPFKPIILRGLPTEDASTLFAGNVVLNLSKATKISNVSVTLKSHAITYWPEGIGARGTKLTAEKSLGQQTLEILAPNIDKNAPVLVLPAGTHRFSFAFVVPNSTVATIEDTFGRVRHVVEAEVQRPGIVMLSSWRISKPVMILRTYMSNSLLTNNSLANLSRTFEKHMVFGDIEVLIEAAAFSSGDLFYIRMIIEPHLKHTRIEHMEVNVTETRRYSVPEMRAWRNDAITFPMPFAGSVRLAEFGEVDVTTEQLAPIFDKNQNGIELVHDFAHRLAFHAPTCQQNIRHTTYIKEIQFRHHLEISLTLSYLDVEGNRQFLSRSSSQTSLEDTITVPEPSIATGTLTPPPAAHFANHNHHNSSRAIGAPMTLPRLSRPPTPTSNSSSSSLPSTPSSSIAATQSSQQQQQNSASWSNVLLRLNKTKVDQDIQDGRNRETITLESAITVFDCRLKEDYGKLPSYHELGVKPSLTVNSTSNKKSKYKVQSTVTTMDKPNQPHPYLCACYHAFCREMELASQALYLPTESAPAMPLLDRIPSIPPPDYAA
ncbi:hypothetical protein HMPREF1544_07053 [Mucor circinelloides 1006PhL]|uniref:Arrestin-like N-terminal domain-containing protein n=1 Tax=Mucor circinelloides f. circinelloides (strain 1006PhL) TaxID=1220926 RepID=S2J7N1_MUCC1|nr:hypothetical protein HMPREF1544_07053 [Mucor circinelloides 1006PhL]